MTTSNLVKLSKRSRWRPLRPGDIVDIVAPSFATDMKDVLQAEEALLRWGLVPRRTSLLFGKDVLCANSDENRFSDLKRALYRQDSAAIWCLRGGYGALRLLSSLARLRRPEHVKLLLGYSDISTLHHFFNDHWKWPTLHGPMLDRFALNKLTQGDERLLKRVLFGEVNEVEFSSLRPLHLPQKKMQKIVGKVAGGNLATVVSSMGTPWQAIGRNRIVFFEEIGERGHQVDRLLTQLSLAGYFKGARAIVFGEFLGGNEPSTGQPKWPAVLKRFATEQKVPVFQGLPVGHGVRQKVLPFFTRAELKLEKGRGRLTVTAGHTG